MRLPWKRELLAVCGVGALGGCSLIYDLSPNQCGTNSDCSSFGAGYVCEEGTCTANGGGTGGTAGTAGTGGSVGECETSADCLAADQNTPRACIENTPGNKGTRTCVELRTEQCPLILPIGGSPERELWRENLESPDSIVIGAYGYLPPDLDWPDIRNYDLALTELDQEGGIPGRDGTSRPVIAVVCNTDYEGNSELFLGVDHLVRDLRVPGIIASLLADELQTAFTRTQTIEENPNVFFMSPLDNDEAIAGLQDRNLVWNNLPNGKEISPPYGPLFTRTIDYLHSSGRVPASDTIRVAVLVASDIRVVADIAANLPTLITFNGKTYQENRDDGNLTVATNMPSSYDNSYATANYKPFVDNILALHPQVVMALGADEIFTKIIPEVERRWPTEAPMGEALPFYILSPYGYNSASIVSTTLAHGADELSKRMVGVNWATAIPAYQYVLQDYLGRMSALYTDRPADLGYENWYDASWFLIDAMAAGARNQPNFQFDGTQLASGMLRLLSGDEYIMDPQQFSDAMIALSSPASSITLVGPMGPPNFDATGARTGVGSVWCITPAGMQNTDVLRLEETGELTGDDITDCIPNF